MNRVLMVAALALAGCNSGKPSNNPEGNPNHGVVEIRLEDGTRCVSLYAKAISCDWRSGLAREVQP